MGLRDLLSKIQLRAIELAIEVTEILPPEGCLCYDKSQQCKTAIVYISKDVHIQGTHAVCVVCVSCVCRVSRGGRGEDRWGGEIGGAQGGGGGSSHGGYVHHPQALTHRPPHGTSRITPRSEPKTLFSVNLKSNHFILV
jgi:hypothetical protein